MLHAERREILEFRPLGGILSGSMRGRRKSGAVWVARERKLVEIVKERREMAAEEAAAAVPPAPAAEAVATTDAHH